MLLNTLVIALFTLLMLFFAYREIRSYRTDFRDYRSLIVSLGLLGTFTGILIGLWGFDTHTIRASVPQLLEGLKTAFITSIVGMALSIMLGAYERLRPPKETTQQRTETTPVEEELYPVLKELVSETVQSRVRMQEQSERQHREMLRQLKNGFAALDRTLSDSGSQAVIDALRTTMAEFNDHLVESFGENFKALDRSIGEMVTWQERYRNDVAAFETVLRTTTETTRRSSEALLALFKTASVEYRAAFEALSASLQESADKNLEVVRASASEVYRNFDELIKVQQHLDTMTRNYERMAQIAQRLERLDGNKNE